MRPFRDSEAETMHNLKGQPLNMQTGQRQTLKMLFCFRDLISDFQEFLHNIHPNFSKFKAY